MPDVFITMKEAAEFEGLTYKGMTSRVSRNPKQYKTKTQPQEGGGKEQVLIAVSSLSPKGRKAWRAAQKVDGRDVVIEKRTESAPWYVGVDLNHYTEQNKKAFYEAVELAARVQDFIDYDGPDRTAYAERYALGLGVSLPTLYRYVENVLKASAWALKMEKEDGQNRDYFRALALCRKLLGGEGAVRVHGGGFAGTVQAFVPVEELAQFKEQMEAILGAGRCHVLSIRPEGGAVL